MSSNFYSVGLNHVGAYQVAGRPWISGSLLPINPDESLMFEFQNVTKRVLVRTNDSAIVRIHFAPYTASFGYDNGASVNDNYILLSGPGEVDLDVKCKEIFISSPDATGAESVEIYAELTNIPRERMFSLDGVEGVTS